MESSGHVMWDEEEEEGEVEREEGEGVQDWKRKVNEKKEGTGEGGIWNGFYWSWQKTSINILVNQMVKHKIQRD